MDTEHFSTVTAAERNENAGVARTADFFSMFDLPSSRPYTDVHFSSSSYKMPFQSAASAMMGGILSVLDTAIDTALAVLNENEELDKPGRDELQGHTMSCVSSERSIMKCYHRGSRCQLPTPTPCRSFDGISSTNTDSGKLSNSKPSDDKTSVILGHTSNQEINMHDLDHAKEGDTCKPQMPNIDSVSTLQLYGENTDDATKKKLLDLPSESMNDVFTDSRSESRKKKEDSEYFFVRNKTETTNDGWLIVCDD